MPKSRPDAFPDTEASSTQAFIDRLTELAMVHALPIAKRGLKKAYEKTDEKAMEAAMASMKKGLRKLGIDMPVTGYTKPTAEEMEEEAQEAAHANVRIVVTSWLETLRQATQHGHAVFLDANLWPEKGTLDEELMRALKGNIGQTLFTPGNITKLMQAIRAYLVELGVDNKGVVLPFNMMISKAEQGAGYMVAKRD